LSNKSHDLNRDNLFISDSLLHKKLLNTSRCAAWNYSSIHLLFIYIR